MAFEEDKQAAKDTLLAPTDKRVDMYRNCLIELKAALTNEQWNPNPYEIRPTVPAPGELDFLEEREAVRGLPAHPSHGRHGTLVQVSRASPDEDPLRG